MKIIIWDHNRDGMLERAAIAYSDPQAAEYIWGCAFHWYGDARFETWPQRSEVRFEDRSRKDVSLSELRARVGFENVRKVSDLCPEKHLIMSEGCQELGGRKLVEVLGQWKCGERYGMNIISDLNSGTEGWIDWNLCLDERGGPNHVENNCLAPIICDTKKDTVHCQPPYWYIGHFSKYIRPGAQRLVSSTSRDVLETVAFLNSDESIALVVMNQSEDNIEFWLKLPGCAARAAAPPRSITTFIIDDRREGTELCGAFVSRCALETRHGTYLKALRDKNERHRVQTAAGWSGWETFWRFQQTGDEFFYLKTHHGDWLSVTQDGQVATSSSAGEAERFTFVDVGDERCAVKSITHHSYLSVGPGVDAPVTAVSALHASEAFVVHGGGASACS